MPQPHRPPSWLLPLLLLLGMAVGYGTTLWADFAFDDHMLIVHNPSVHDPRVFAQNVFGPFFANTILERALVFFRPLVLTSYFLSYQLFGLHPAPYHLTNLLLHFINGLLAAGVARTWFGLRPWGALTAGVVFTLHPVQTEAVSWISGRTDLLSGTGILGTVLLAWHWLRRPSFGTLIALILVYHVGLLSKENSVTIAPLLLPLIWLRWGVLNRTGRAPRQVAYLLGVLALFGLHFLLWRSVALTTPAPITIWPTGSHMTTLLSIPRVWILYLRLLLWPHPYTLDYTVTNIGIVSSPAEARFWLALLGCGLLALLALLLLKRRNPAGAALVWFAMILAPVSHVRPMPGLAAERYLYMATLAAGVIAGLGAQALAARWARQARRWLPALAATLLTLFLAAADLPRARIWRNDLALFTHALSRDPLNTHRLLNCADILVDAGRVQEAHDLLVTNPCPRNAFFDQVLAMALFRLGRPQEAAARLEAALDYVGPHTGVYAPLAEWYLDTGQLDRAAYVLNLAVKADPGDSRLPPLIARLQQASVRNPPPR